LGFGHFLTDKSVVSGSGAAFSGNPRLRKATLTGSMRSKAKYFDSSKPGKNDKFAGRGNIGIRIFDEFVHSYQNTHVKIRVNITKPFLFHQLQLNEQDCLSLERISNSF
jgi:hypothetical protein